MSVTEVHDVDGLLCVEHLVVEVIPAPAEKQTADMTEELARRATSRLGYVLDQRQGAINFVREQVSGRRPVVAPPQQCGFDLRNGNRRNSDGVGRHRPRRPAGRSGTAAKLPANGAHRDATASRNLSDPLQHTRFLVRIEADRGSVVVRDEREACPLGKPRACDDRTLDHPGTGKPHGHTIAGHCPDRDGRRGALVGRDGGLGRRVHEAEEAMMCVICRQGEIQPGKATVTLERRRAIVVVRGVPARVCENCGEEYLDRTTTAELLKTADAAAQAGVQVDVRYYVAG
jgi:YgiT-type zinc finger domain-containing protein